MPTTTLSRCNIKAGPLPKLRFIQENIDKLMPTNARKIDKKPVRKKKKPMTVRMVLVFDDIANIFCKAKKSILAYNLGAFGQFLDQFSHLLNTLLYKLSIKLLYFYGKIKVQN